MVVADAPPERDAPPDWYPGGDTITMGDNRMIEQPSEAPQLVGLGQAPPSLLPTYDWRVDTNRGPSAHPFGSPQDGDTYTRDGEAYHTVGGGTVLQPIDLITRWMDQLPTQLHGANWGENHEDFVHYMRPVVSPIPHHNRWERAALHHAAMDLARDGVLRISTPSASRGGTIVPYIAGPQSEVYDGGGTRLSTYTPSPHDHRPARQFNVCIARYQPQLGPAGEDTGQEYDSVGTALPRESSHDIQDDIAATQSPDSVDNLQ